MYLNPNPQDNFLKKGPELALLCHSVTQFLHTVEAAVLRAELRSNKLTPQHHLLQSSAEGWVCALSSLRV